MEIHLQSDGQLYPPKPSKPKSKPKPEPPQSPCLPATTTPKKQGDWEDLLLLAIMFIIFRSKDQPDLFLLAALAYVLFDSCFSLKNLL